MAVDEAVLAEIIPETYYLVVFPDATRIIIADSLFKDFDFNGFDPAECVVLNFEQKPDETRIADFIPAFDGRAVLPEAAPAPPPESLGSSRVFCENVAIEPAITVLEFALAHRIGYCLSTEIRRKIWSENKDLLPPETQIIFLTAGKKAGILLEI